MEQQLTTSLEISPPRTVWEDLLRAGIPIVILGTAVLGLIYWGRPKQAAIAEPNKPAAVGVVTAEAKEFTDSIEILVDGVAQPHRHISIAAEISGRIIRKSPDCNDGNFVAAGEMLYEIDPSDYDSAVSRIKEELSQAENSIKEWEVERNNTVEQLALVDQDLEFAVKEANRLRSLRKENAASTAELEQALRTEVGARLSVQNLKNQIRALDARKARTQSALELQKIDLAKAMRNLERTKIFAPVDCTVVTDDCEEGSYVQAGKVVAIINDVSKAEVGCQLELDDLYWIWKMRPASELTENLKQPGKVYDIPPVKVFVEFPFHDRLIQWTGVISRLGGTGIDLSTRTIPCRVLVENPMQSTVVTRDRKEAKDFLPPPLATGMFVSVRIPVKPSDPLVEVPSTSVRSGNVIWLVREGKLKIQNIKIARRARDRVLLHADGNSFQVGDRVIVSPLAVAEDGMAVQEKQGE